MSRQLREALQKYCDAVDAVMADNFIYGRCTGGTVGPRTIKFRFDYTPPFNFTEEQLKENRIRERLCAVLGVPAVELSVLDGVCYIAMSNPYPYKETFENVMRELGPSGFKDGEALAGINVESGAPVIINFNHHIAHLLVTGNPGCGKTALLRSICLSLLLASNPESTFIIAGEKLERAFPYDRVIRAGKTAYHQIVANALATIHRRQAQHKPRSEFPHGFIVVDEFTEFIYDTAVSMDDLMEIMRSGAEVNVHLICSTAYAHQMGVAKVLDQLEFPLRLCGTQWDFPHRDDFDLQCGMFVVQPAQAEAESMVIESCYVSRYDALQIAQKGLTL